MSREPGHPEPLETRVLHFLREQQLLPAGQQLLVAVSGGPDSVCLLHILAKLQAELRIKLHVAHLNHQLRGAASAADARYVARLVQQLGIPATIAKRDVKAYQSRQRLSREEAAREVRYAFLAEVARSIGADHVAVGHTADDHIETVLMHLIRGTGTRGLRGLKPSSPWPSSDSRLTVIRPLLPVTRAVTEAYCQDHQLRPRVDASNRSLSLLRNKIRLQLLPQLRRYNPRITEALLRTARIADDDFAFLAQESARLRMGIVQRQGDTITLDKTSLRNLPPALQRHLLRTVIAELLGNPKDIEARHIEAIMAALTKPAGKRLNLPGGLIFTIEYNRYLLGLDPASLSPFPVLEEEFTLKIPGEVSFADWKVIANIITPAAVEEKLVVGGPVAYFDRDKVGGPVSVRRYQPGDRWQPLGLSQPKKLGEFMIDAKIPRAWRRRVPIVVSSRHILWVVGGRIDERVKVTEATRQVLRLEFKPAS